jgi:hypothetical protein
MRRFALVALLLGWAFVTLAIFAPLSQAALFVPHRSTVTQLDIGGNLFDQINSLFNNFTKQFNINPLTPQQAATPSVKIASVKAASGQSGATPQVTVVLKNGKVALDGVRTDIFYKNAAGATVASDGTVVALKTDETRSLTFTPNGLQSGSYAIGVIVYKNGTDPSNQATPPYDTQQNAATLVIASPTPAGAAAAKAGDAGSQTNNAGDVLTHFNTWVYFVIAITGLITVALFFVFSQNRSGDDRYEEAHFTGDGYPAAGTSTFGAPALGYESPSAERLRDNAPETAYRRRVSRRIEVDAPEQAPEEQDSPEVTNHPQPTEDALQFDDDGFVVGDVTSRKALRNKIRGKRGA